MVRPNKGERREGDKDTIGLKEKIIRKRMIVVI
jgi:hypothetical protein